MTVTRQDADITKWYAMAAYKFELKAENSLREAGLEVYLPKETIYVKKPHRRPTPEERPAISTLIFVHATRERILDYKRRIDDRLKFRMSSIADGDYLTVPDNQMAAFISIWASRDTLQASLSPLISSQSTSLPHSPASPLSHQEPCHVLDPAGPSSLPAGTPVEITAGPLAGLRATLLAPITPRSRTARLTLPLATLLSITLTLPTTALSFTQ